MVVFDYENRGIWLAGIFDSGRVSLVDRMNGNYRYFNIKMSGKKKFIEDMREMIGFGNIYNSSNIEPDNRQLFITSRRDILKFIDMIDGKVIFRKQVLEEFKKNVEESMRKKNNNDEV